MGDDDTDILHQTFKKHDKDNSGFLDEKEMFFAMQDIMGCKVTEDMVRKVIKEIDTNGSGTIELEEFYDVFERCDAIIQEAEMMAKVSPSSVQAGGSHIPSAALTELGGTSQQILQVVVELQATIREQAVQHAEALRVMSEQHAAALEGVRQAGEATAAGLREELGLLREDVAKANAEVANMKTTLTAISEGSKKEKKDKKEKKASDIPDGAELE